MATKKAATRMRGECFQILVGVEIIRLYSGSLPGVFPVVAEVKKQARLHHGLFDLDDPLHATDR